MYVEFAKLQAHFKNQVHPLDSDAAIKRSTELANSAEQVMFGFNVYQFENLDESDAPANDPAANFKKAVKAAVDYLDDTEPGGYSLRNYAEREKITSPEFRYLMNRCMDITGVAPKGRSDDEIAGYDMAARWRSATTSSPRRKKSSRRTTSSWASNTGSDQ